MPKHKPTTKAGKRNKVGKVMSEFKRGSLKSSSGDKVTNPAQAKAIAMSEAGMSRPSTQGREANNPKGSTAVGEGAGQKRAIP